MATDPAEQALLDRLGRQAQQAVDPFNPFEVKATVNEAFQATALRLDIKAAQEAREKQAHDMMLEEERLKLDVAKLELGAREENRRLDLEFARLEVQKAEVIVRALEIAARNPEITQLAGVAQELSTRLLGGERVPALQIAEKSEG